MVRVVLDTSSVTFDLARRCLRVEEFAGVAAWIIFFQAEDGIRDLVRSRGLGDVYKRQARHLSVLPQPLRERSLHLLQPPVTSFAYDIVPIEALAYFPRCARAVSYTHLTLPTSDLV